MTCYNCGPRAGHASSECPLGRWASPVKAERVIPHVVAPAFQLAVPAPPYAIDFADVGYLAESPWLCVTCGAPGANSKQGCTVCVGFGHKARETFKRASSFVDYDGRIWIKRTEGWGQP